MIVLIISATIICIAIHWATMPGELLGFLAKYAGYKISKPLYSCMACMGSVWGITIYTSATYLMPIELGAWNWLWCVTFCLLLSGSNRIAYPIVRFLYMIPAAQVRIENQELIYITKQQDETINEQAQVIEELQKRIDGQAVVCVAE